MTSSNRFPAGGKRHRLCSRDRRGGPAKRPRSGSACCRCRTRDRRARQQLRAQRLGDGGHGRGIFQSTIAGTRLPRAPQRWTRPAMPIMPPECSQASLGGMTATSTPRSRPTTAARRPPQARRRAGRTAPTSDTPIRCCVTTASSPAPPAPRLGQASAVAESPAEVASVGSLSAAAQRYPPSLALPAPRLPAFAPAGASHAHPFHRQPTDYVSLFSDDTNETDS